MSNLDAQPCVDAVVGEVADGPETGEESVIALSGGSAVGSEAGALSGDCCRACLDGGVIWEGDGSP